MVGRRFLLSPSPNWYAAHATDVSEQGLLAYGAHNSIVIYDTSESRIRGILHGHTNRVTAVAFAEGASGSQCLISGAADRSLRVWNVSSLSCTQTITKRPAEVSAITVAGKGNIIAIGDQGGNVSLWNLQKSRKPQKVQGLKCKSSISCMAAAPKANSGLTSTSSPYWQGDFSQSEGHRVVKQAPPPWVAIGCNDGSVCIVDVDHAELLCTLQQHRANVQSVSWAAIPVQSSPGVHNSAVSSVLASTSADGCIHTYSFPPWSGVPQSGTSQGAVASVMAVTATGVKSLELMTERASACDQERAGLPHGGCSAEASMRAEAGCNREGAESMQARIGREQAPTVEGGANAPIAAGTSNAADPCRAVGGSVSSGSASVPGLRPGVIPSESRVETGGFEEVGISVAAEVTTKHELCTHDEMVSGATITEKPGWSSGKGGIELPRSYANPTMLCMLKLPPPPAGLSHGQKERLWVAATWVPMCCNKSLTSNHDHTWLLSSGYGGSLLAWHVPLVPGSRPPPPQRLPSAGGHSRTVFTLQSLCLLGAAAEPGLVTCLSAAQRTQQEELIHPRAWKEGTAKSKEVWESVTVAAVPAVSDLDSSRTVSPDGAHCRFEAAGHDSATRSPKQPDEGITHPQADCTAPVPPPPPPGEPPMHPPPHLGALNVPPESPSRSSSEVARGEMNGGPWGPMDAWKSSSWVPERSRAAQEGATGGDGPAFQETATSSWHPRVCVISTGLDRAVLQWQLPCLAGGKDALKHAQVTWGMTGLGGHAYALACSSPNSSMHSMLAVGCGDKSIRMLDLSGGQARARSQPSKLTNVDAFPDETPAGGVEQHESGYVEHDDIMPAVTRGADTAHATELCDRDPCPAGGPSSGVQHAQQVLIWQGIPDKVTAVAWCPAEHAELGRLLAFGCQDGTVGVVKVGRGQSPAPCCPFSMKHKGPILELRWLLGSCFSALISLSADGTLLQWGPWEDPFQLAGAAPHCKAGRKGQEGRGGGTSVCKEIAHSGQSMIRAGSKESKRSSDNDSRAGQLPRDLGADLKQQAESQRTSQVDAAETEGARWHGDVASAVPDSQLTRQAASADRGQGLGVLSALDVSCRKGRNPCQIAVGCTDGSLSVFEENSFKSPQSSGRNSVIASSSAMTAESVVTKPFQCLIAGAELSQLDAHFHLSWTEAGFGGVAFTQVLFCPSDTRLLATADVLGSVAVHAVASGISEEAKGKGLQGSFRLEAGDQALLSRVELGRQVTALSWHPLHRDRIACALSDFSIQVLALEGRQLTAGRKFRGHAGIVRGLAWHPAVDHLLLSGSEDQSVRQWSLLQQPQQQQRQHGGQVPAATELTPAPSAHIAGPQRPDVPAHPSFDAPPPDNLCPASGDPVPPQHSALQVEPPIASESILPGPTVPAPGESAKGGAMVRSAEGPAGSLMGAPGPVVAKVEGASTAEVPGREAELQKGHPGSSASPPAPPAVAVSGGSGKRDRVEERRDGSVAVEISGEARDLELGAPEEAATEKGARRGAPLFAPKNKGTQQQQQQQQDLKCVAKQQEAAAEGSVQKGSRAAAGSSTKKSGGSAGTLGRRQLLSHGVASAQQAQHGGKHPTPSANNHSQLNACLQLARGLLPAHIPSTETGGTCNTAGGPSTMGQGQFASTAGPPLLQEAASLVGCGPDPLTASFLLGKQAELLGQAAVGSKTFQSRHSMAQRSAALSLWRGDVGAALQTLLENNALTADFVSMSAAAGRPAWEAVVRVYATQLAAGGEPHLAALHLLSIGDVHAAVRVYREEGMLQEAVEVASARLLPQDPVLQELRRLHAAQLASKGLMEQAAAQYMAAGLWGSAAEALAGSATPGAVDAAREVCCLVMGGAPGEHEGSSKAPGPRETAVESLGARDTTRTGTSTAADIASGAGEECSSSSTPPGERPPPCKAQAEGGKAPAAQLPPRELVMLRKAMARLEGAASGGTSPSSGARGAPHCGSPHPGSARPRRRYSLQELMLLSGSGGTCQLPPDVRELAARPGS